MATAAAGDAADGPPSSRILLLLVFMRVTVVGRPFIGNLEGLSATVSLAGARNYLRYGVWSSRGAPVINPGRVPEEHWVLYANHPPLHPLAVATSMGVFGESEAACRLVPDAVRPRGRSARVRHDGTSVWLACRDVCGRCSSHSVRWSWYMATRPTTSVASSFCSGWRVSKGTCASWKRRAADG